MKSIRKASAVHFYAMINLKYRLEALMRRSVVPEFECILKRARRLESASGDTISFGTPPTLLIGAPFNLGISTTTTYPHILRMLPSYTSVTEPPSGDGRLSHDVPRL